MGRREVISYIGGKLLAALGTLLLVTLFSFLLMRLSPIDPAEAYVKRNSAMVTQEQIDAAREKLGLDQPLHRQYLRWLGKAVRLDWGTSLATGRSVAVELKNTLPTTLRVVTISAVITMGGVLLFGCLGAMSASGWLAKLLRLCAILGVSVPAFYLATAFLDFFAMKIGAISVVSNVGAGRYVPPALCLCVSGICFYGQMLADSLRDQRTQDHCVYAQCRGLGESRILLFHALPHALIDLMPSFAQMLGMSLANAAIVERVFSLSGLGYLMIDSVLARDAPVIHAVVLVLAGALVLLDAAAEVAQKLLRQKW